MNEKFDLILFDLDGTLTDSSEGITKSIQYALRKAGIEEPDLNNLKKFIGPPLIDALMEFYGFSREQAIEVRKYFSNRYQPVGWKENCLYPGIKIVLETLQKSGKTLCIATSKIECLTDKVLEYFDLKKYFSIISAAPDNGLNGEKSIRIQTAIEIAKKSGYDVKNPVMVGDTRYDVLGAHKCNIPCIGVTWGFSLDGEFEHYHTEYVANSMEELLILLE